MTTAGLSLTATARLFKANFDIYISAVYISHVYLSYPYA